MPLADDSSRAEAALVIALMIFVAGLCLQPVTESDLFFRVKVGQEILAHGALMGRNLFSFTAPAHPDLDLAWLFEVGVALLFRAGGFPAVVLGKTVVILGAFTLTYRAARRAGAGALSSALALTGAAFVMRERFVERPHVLSFVGEAVVLVCATGLTKPLSVRRIALFAAAMIVWANGHAGMFAGALMLFAAAAGAFPSDRAQARRALLLGALVVAAAFATPVGVGIVRYLALHVTLPRLHAIDEFRGATWRSDAPFFVWTLVVVAATVATMRRAGANAWLALLPALLPVVALSLLGMWSVRFSADAALVAAPFLATRLTRLLPEEAGSRRLSALRAGTVVLLLGAALVPRAVAARAGRPFISVGLDPSVVPSEALQFVTAHGLRERMYNDFETGSYLAFEGYPRYRVFVDPRLPAYPEEMHRLLGNFDLDRPSWDAAMTRHGVTSALLAYAGLNRRVAWWDPERWALVFRAFDARVFVRRLPAWQALIARYEIPATFSFTVENGAETLPLSTRPAASPVSACEWQRRLGDLLFDVDGGSLTRALPAYDRALATPGCLAPPDETALAAWLGGTALKAGQLARALALLDRALALAPADTPSRANRAAAYEALGRRGDAASDWLRVADEAAGTPLGKAARARAERLGSRDGQAIRN